MPPGISDLRLAVVSPFVDRRHGTERALTSLLEQLSGEFHYEIHLYAERVDDLALSAEGDPLPSTGSITWHTVPAVPGPHIFKFLFWMTANTILRWWHRVSRGLRFELVLSPGINCLDADVVVVHAVFRRLRELARQESMSGSRGSGRARRLHRRLYYSVLTLLERIVYSNRKTTLAAVSQRTAGLLAQYFHRSDVAVIPNGIDAVQFSVPARLAMRQGARFRRKLSKQELVLLLIGNDWRAKGVPEVLAAMAKVPDLPLRLIVAGSDVATSFQQEAERLRVADRCRWESPRSDVIDLFAAADIYVSPSKEDSFGLPVAEAMACGLPVITSRFAGVSELIQNEIDGYVLSDPSNIDGLAESLRRLYDAPDLRVRIGEAAATAAQQWTWERNAVRTWELLQTVAAKRAVKAS
jgi:UDP-glucose:(heptosyl)LPS alpha-1,3-glucosyltransferase